MWLGPSQAVPHPEFTFHPFVLQDPNLTEGGQVPVDGSIVDTTAVSRVRVLFQLGDPGEHIGQRLTAVKCKDPGLTMNALPGR